MRVICDYCGKDAELVSGDQIYHRGKYSHLKFWVCWPCGAHVGCHKQHRIYSPNGITPFGSLANAELRKLRSEVHAKLDPRWKNIATKNSNENRRQIYEWLASRMVIPLDECHIALFREDDCRKALKILSTPGDNIRAQRINQKPQQGKEECPFCYRYVKKGSLFNHQRDSLKCKRLRGTLREKRMAN